MSDFPTVQFFEPQRFRLRARTLERSAALLDRQRGQLLRR